MYVRKLTGAEWQKLQVCTFSGMLRGEAKVSPRLAQLELISMPCCFRWLLHLWRAFLSLAYWIARANATSRAELSKRRASQNHVLLPCARARTRFMECGFSPYPTSIPITTTATFCTAIALGVIIIFQCNARIQHWNFTYSVIIISKTNKW